MSQLPRPRPILLTALLAVAAAGCGLSTYEERLRRTNERNQYLARLDDLLAPYWNHPQYGIWLRPPKGFVPMAAPARPKDPEDEPPPDRRQEFQGTALDIPGVIQAWEALLPVAGGGTGPYRLYVLGNHERFLAADRYGKPAEFVQGLEQSLGGLFAVELPPGDGGRGDQDNVKYRQMIPSTEQFVVPKLFQAVNYVNPRGDTAFRAQLFEHASGQVQVAVLLLTPPTPAVAPRQTLLTALETLQASSTPPRGQPGGAVVPGGAVGPNF